MPWHHATRQLAQKQWLSAQLCCLLDLATDKLFSLLYFGGGMVGCFFHCCFVVRVVFVLRNPLTHCKDKGILTLICFFPSHLSLPPEIILLCSKTVFFRMYLALSRIITQLYSSEAVVLGNLENI